MALGKGGGAGGGEGASVSILVGTDRTDRRGTPGLFTQWEHRAAGQGSKVILRPGCQQARHTQMLVISNLRCVCETTLVLKLK